MLLPDIRKAARKLNKRLRTRGEKNGDSAMPHLPTSATDEELISFIDRWAALMELEDYEQAYAFTGHFPEMEWSPALMRYAIKEYGECHPEQKVTLHGQPTDITQRKDVSRWPRTERGELGEIWYDLNIDGYVSDLTAIFRIVENDSGLEIKLFTIHVM